MSFSVSRFERRSSNSASPLRSLTVVQRLGELDDALLVGTPVDEDASLVEDLFHRDDLALSIGVAHADDGEGLVEHHFVAARDLGRVETRVQGHAHLASRGEDVHGPVFVEAGEGAIDRRRLGQLLDFVAQRGDLVPGLLDGDRKFLVVRAGLGQLAARLEELLLEYLDAAVGLVDVAQREVAGGRRRSVLALSLVPSSNPLERSIGPP